MMMAELLKYLRIRLRHFDSMQGPLNVQLSLINPLIDIFEARILA